MPFCWMVRYFLKSVEKLERIQPRSYETLNLAKHTKVFEIGEK